MCSHWSHEVNTWKLSTLILISNEFKEWKWRWIWQTIIRVRFIMFIACFLYRIRNELTSVYSCRVELKSKEIVFNEEIPDYPANQMLRLGFKLMPAQKRPRKNRSRSPRYYQVLNQQFEIHFKWYRRCHWLLFRSQLLVTACVYQMGGQANV